MNNFNRINKSCIQAYDIRGLSVTHSPQSICTTSTIS